MRNLKDERTMIFPSTTRGGKELPSSSALDSPSIISRLATPKPTTVTIIIIPLWLLNTLLQILSYPGVVELTTQLLILKNILWLPLCRINKFGLNTLPSKAVVIPYTCGLSRLISGAVAEEHSSIL